MANMIVDAIKGKGKVEYSSNDNPLDVQYLRVSQIKSVMRLLSELALNEDVDCNNEGFGVICKMVAEELDDVDTQLDRANMEICRAINGYYDEEIGSQETKKPTRAREARTGNPESRA